MAVPRVRPSGTEPKIKYYLYGKANLRGKFSDKNWAPQR